MSRPSLPVELIREFLTYEPATGHVRWLKRPYTRSKRMAGDIAGCFDDHGYVLIGFRGHLMKGHRVAWALMTGAWPDGLIDHRDRNTSNNVWTNLRVVDDSENAQNVDKRGSRSVFRGAMWIEKKQHWHTYITHRGNRYFLGSHKTLLDAAAARISAERRLFTHNIESRS